MNLGMDGEDADGIIHGIDFLKKLNYQESFESGEKVGIIGGGNTAIDSARAAKRLDKEATHLLSPHKKRNACQP